VIVLLDSKAIIEIYGKTGLQEIIRKRVRAPANFNLCLIYIMKVFGLSVVIVVLIILSAGIASRFFTYVRPGTDKSLGHPNKQLNRAADSARKLHTATQRRLSPYLPPMQHYTMFEGKSVPLIIYVVSQFARYPDTRQLLRRSSMPLQRRKIIRPNPQIVAGQWQATGLHVSHHR
jgi:hypothetical protein